MTAVKYDSFPVTAVKFDGFSMTVVMFEDLTKTISILSSCGILYETFDSFFFHFQDTSR